MGEISRILNRDKKGKPEHETLNLILMELRDQKELTKGLVASMNELCNHALKKVVTKQDVEMKPLKRKKPGPKPKPRTVPQFKWECDKCCKKLIAVKPPEKCPACKFRTSFTKV